MKPISVFLVAGARPNFMKVAPVYRTLTSSPRFSVTLVHTGQHYDKELSGVFFRELGLPDPEIRLDVGSGSHGVQTARVLERFENALVDREPDLVVVVGDVNSTMACALAATKTEYRSGRRPRVAHVEAGLRSFDRTMPEEINRVVTDALSDFLFTSEESANLNLSREGIPAEKIFFVGNVMIDTLLDQARRASALKAWETFGLEEREYAVLTLHRPSNVDDSAVLTDLMGTLDEVGQRIPIIFPAHPRTIARAREFRIDVPPRSGLRLTEALGYVEFLSLMGSARLVLTDSGGIQEETTVLGIPCLTLRENTERPATITQGTNRLVGRDRNRILEAVGHILDGEVRRVQVPELWDGKAATRIVKNLEVCL